MMDFFNSFSSPIAYYLLLFFVAAKIIQKLSWLSHKAYYDPRQPPFVPYTLPFLGSALSFKKDPHAFISKWCRHFQSPIFSAYIAGQSFVFIQDPYLINYYTSGRIPELAWKDLRFKIVRNVMTVSEEGSKVIAENMEEHAILEKHLLKKENLNDVLMGFQVVIQEKFLPKLMSCNESKNEEWSSQKILQFFGRLLYLSNTQVLFGSSSMATDEFFDHAMNFDKSAINFAKTPIDKQAMKYPKGYHARNELIKKMLSTFESIPKTENDENAVSADAPTPMTQDLKNLYKGKLSEEDLSLRQLSLHWASYTNALPTLFWTVFHLLSSKEAYLTIVKEVSSIYDEIKTKKNGQKMFSLEDIDRMTHLDSLLMETIRLITTQKALRVRFASKDFEVQLPLPGKDKKDVRFHVKKDTKFMSSTTLLHRDGEIFQNPLEFQWDRFVSQTRFTKNGRIVARPVNPFGNGISMCPGRRFALMEIKYIIATVLLDFDVQFPNGESIVPPSLHATKAIASTSFPASDVSFEIRKRK